MREQQQGPPWERSSGCRVWWSWRSGTSLGWTLCRCWRRCRRTRPSPNWCATCRRCWSMAARRRETCRLDEVSCLFACLFVTIIALQPGTVALLMIWVLELLNVYSQLLLYFVPGVVQLCCCCHLPPAPFTSISTLFDPFFGCTVLHYSHLRHLPPLPLYLTPSLIVPYCIAPSITTLFDPFFVYLHYHSI